MAKGFILNADLTLTPTFVARVGDSFAHGKTAQEAVNDATKKDQERRPVEERAAAFLVKYPIGTTHLGHDLFEGHRMLTGSCKQGCEQFVKDKDIDLDCGYTLREFIAITRNAYATEAIEALEKAIGDSR